MLVVHILSMRLADTALAGRSVTGHRDGTPAAGKDLFRSRPGARC